MSSATPGLPARLRIHQVAGEPIAVTLFRAAGFDYAGALYGAHACRMPRIDETGEQGR